MSTTEGSESSKKKLPYFHRELSAEDAALVGDTRPKPVANCFSGPPAAGSGSAWNAAGSWEEHDCTDKCTELLDGILDGDYPDLESGLCILSCQEVKGTASLVYSKGRPRFLYAFTVHLKAEMTATDGKAYTVMLVLDDVQNDQPPEDYDLSVEWTTGSPHGSALPAAKAAILSRKTRSALRAKLALFEEAYRELFAPPSAA